MKNKLLTVIALSAVLSAACAVNVSADECLHANRIRTVESLSEQDMESHFVGNSCDNYCEGDIPTYSHTVTYSCADCGAELEPPEEIYIAEHTSQNCLKEIEEIEARGFHHYNGKTYYYDTDGSMHKGQLKTSSGEIFYFGSDGAMLRSKLCKTTDGHTVYFMSSGKMAVSRTILINDEVYVFGKDGRLVTEKIAPSEIGDFTFGAPRKKALGVKGYTNISLIEKNENGTVYEGDVLLGGTESRLAMRFNPSKELYAFKLSASMDPDTYQDLVIDFFVSDEDFNYDEELDLFVNSYGVGINFFYYDDTGMCEIVCCDLNYSPQ